MNQTEKIIEAFYDVQIQYEKNDIQSFVNKIANQDTLYNYIKYGSNSKLLHSHLKSYSIIYIGSGFVFCKEGIILFEQDYSRKLIRSKGFFHFNINQDIWLRHVSENNKTLGNKLEKLINYKFYENQAKLKSIQQAEEKALKIIEDEKKYIHDKELNSAKKSLINELDKNGDGIIDSIASDAFFDLFTKHQDKIKTIDRSYILKFVCISEYLDLKKNSMQELYSSTMVCSQLESFNENIEMLKDQKHLFEQILFHSINMLISLVQDDDITFFRIFRTFDRLGVFDSEWQQNVTKQLTSIDLNLYKLEFRLGEILKSIHSLEENVSSQLSTLNYAQEDYMNSIGNRVTSELESINSSLQINNLLTGIQTYQTYKMRRELK